MNIFLQDGKFINVLRPSSVAKAAIYNEEERKAILRMIRHKFYPHHTWRGTRYTETLERGEIQRKVWHRFQIDHYLTLFKQLQSHYLFY